MKVHETITGARVMEAVAGSMMDTSNPGFCVACGADAHGVEPDARRYRCAACDDMAVYGAEQLLEELLSTGVVR